MVVEGQEIDQETVEWFTGYILSRKEPFVCTEMVVRAIKNEVPRTIADRFVDRLFQKLRRAGKIRFVGGYWSVVEGA